MLSTVGRGQYWPWRKPLRRGQSPVASAPPVAPAPEVPADKSSYLLQAGAFKGQEDAEGMKAKLALIGFEARIVTAEVNGVTFYRVRVGPYGQIDDMNRARSRLAENGIGHKQQLRFRTPGLNSVTAAA